jgi:RNA polymerase sigma-70 factor, ECF subfamily
MDAGEMAAALVRARQGDDDAFRALVERHSVQAFRLAFRMTGNEQDAEDVVQESFLRAYRQLGRFQARSNFGTWLYRIVANCSVDHLRSRKARRADADVETLDASAAPIVAGQPGPERLARSTEIRLRVSRALEDLSPLERAAFLLRHHEGRSIEEIGRTLGLRTSATKNSVFRAVRKLRAALEPLRSES